MLQQKKLATAAAIALGSTAVVLGSAQAGTIMFPQIAVSPTVTTIISVMNAGEGWEQPLGETLHYRYYWKPWLDKTYNADDPNTLQTENQCREKNRYLPTSKNDIQTFDVSGQFYGSAGRGVMFFDDSTNNDWDRGTVDYRLGAPNTLAGTPAAHRAFLIVDNDDDQFFGDLAGEAVVSEVVSGATWGYQAFQNIDSEDYDFERYASYRYSLVAFMPADEVTTRFNTTVVEGEITGSSYGETVHIGPRVIDSGTEDIVLGAYDRDENFRSGGIDQPVTCIGAWDIQDLFPDAINDIPGIWGWTNITNYRVEYDVSGVKAKPEQQTGAIFKVEYGDSIDGTAVNGIFNNGLYLHPDRMKQYKNGDLTDAVVE
jgi:hypothetical protein